MPDCIDAYEQKTYPNNHEGKVAFKCGIHLLQLFNHELTLLLNYFATFG